MFGICNLGIVPIRSEASDKSEMVSQLLFGDTFKIMESTPKWTKIQTTFDTYEGWIDTKQFQKITENQYLILEKSETVLNGELIDFISYETNQLMPIPLGSSLNFLDIDEINTSNFQFEGQKECGIKSKENILKTAYLYLNAPYLWGGKTPFGIDCSGFTQMVYKLNGYTLSRDASQQAIQGDA
uniref:C40 family peptidase n=1 Tax=Flavobacterium sp. TaxID=239 RepID=UPI001B3D865A